MRTLVLAILGIAVAAAALVVGGPSPEAGQESSHREAPLIAEDPSADTTDLYAFRSLDAPDHLTVIANYIPAEERRSHPVPARGAARRPHRNRQEPDVRRPRPAARAAHGAVAKGHVPVPGTSASPE